MHYLFLARAGDNRVLECIMRIVVFQVGFKIGLLRDTDLIDQRALQRRLTDAIEAGDAPLAKRIARRLHALAMSYGPTRARRPSWSTRANRTRHDHASPAADWHSIDSLRANK
ncbi:MAG: hypothetical protein ABW039_08530 [Sphingobium sp.]